MNRTLLLQQPFHTTLVDTPMPECREDELLLQVNYVGLCGTDLSSYRGKMPLVTYPRIPGHELSATIMDKGSRVPENLQVGHTVTVNPYSQCGHCPACRQGRYNTCQYNQTLGVQRDGALRQYIAVDFTKVFPSPVISPTVLALTEPLSVGYHATRRANLRAGETALVIGCGMIGLGVILAATQQQAAVIAVDLDEAKLAVAEKLGAQHLLHAQRDDPRRLVNGPDAPLRADVIFEAVGSSPTYQLALELAGYAGRVVTIGYAPADIPLNTSLIVRKELDVYGSRNALDEFPLVLGQLESGKWNAEQLISGIFPLEQAGEAFAFWDQHPEKVIKILIKIS